MKVCIEFRSRPLNIWFYRWAIVRRLYFWSVIVGGKADLSSSEQSKPPNKDAHTSNFGNSFSQGQAGTGMVGYFGGNFFLLSSSHPQHSIEEGDDSLRSCLCIVTI